MNPTNSVTLADVTAFLYAVAAVLAALAGLIRALRRLGKGQNFQKR